MCAVPFRKNSTESIREWANMVSKRNSLQNQNNLIFQKREKTQKHKYTAAHILRAWRRAGIKNSELLKLLRKEEVSYKGKQQTRVCCPGASVLCPQLKAGNWRFLYLRQTFPRYAEIQIPLFLPRKMKTWQNSNDKRDKGHRTAKIKR